MSILPPSLSCVASTGTRVSSFFVRFPTLPLWTSVGELLLWSFSLPARVLSLEEILNSMEIWPDLLVSIRPISYYVFHFLAIGNWIFSSLTLLPRSEQFCTHNGFVVNSSFRHFMAQIDPEVVSNLKLGFESD